MNSVIEALHIYDEHKLVKPRVLFLTIEGDSLADHVLLDAPFSPIPTLPDRFPQLTFYLCISNTQHRGLA